MATFAHSNYFRVLDPDTFSRFCADFGIDFTTNSSPAHPGQVFYTMWADSWPDFILEPESGEPLSFLETLTQQLDPRDAAVLFELSHENGLNPAAQAMAITPGKEMVRLDLTDIYLKAREAFGPSVSIMEVA